MDSDEKSSSDGSGWLCKPRLMNNGHQTVPSVKRKRVIISSSEDENDDDAMGAVLSNGHLNNKPKRVMYSSDVDEPSSSDEIDSDASVVVNDIVEDKNLVNDCLRFFNTAQRNQLLSVPRITKKIADFIIEKRPFDSLSRLEKEMKKCSRNTMVLEIFRTFIENRKVMEKILTVCGKHSKQLQTTLRNMENEEFIDTKANPNSTYQLHPYQKFGLKWLVMMHRLKLNTILGDEMGLGKTVQVIAFLSHLKKNSIEGPHLIVVPSSTIENWLSELDIWAPSFVILTYYGDLNDRKYLRAKAVDRNVDAILTTYSMVSSKADDRSFFKRFRINYVIYDEGHFLKNCSTARYNNLMKIRGERKILITGTPLQNNLVELISLMYFIMSDLFDNFCDDVSQFMQQFKQKAKMKDTESTTYETERIEQAKAILHPFILRRLKADVLECLPNKFERIIRCPMLLEQKEIYKDLLQEFCESKNKMASNKLMQLRQVANHPLLYRQIYSDEKVVEIADILCAKEKQYFKKKTEHVAEDLAFLSDFAINQLCLRHKSVFRFRLDNNLACNSGKFRILDDMLPKIKKDDEKVLIFSQFTAMMDIFEIYLKIRHHNYMRLDGSTPVMERQELINKFNARDDVFIFLLSTKAGGLGINLTAANHIFIHDIDFNPYNDKQAEDRCHRMGQKRDVYIYRLISESSVEEEMLNVAQRKLQLEKEVVTGGQLKENISEYEMIEEVLKKTTRLFRK